MMKKTLYPVMAVAALGLAFSFNGCSCQASVGEPPKAAEPPPPPPPQAVPPPAPEPPVATPAPPAEPTVKLSKLKPVGKAKIEGDQIKIPGKLEFDVDKATIRNDTGSQEILKTLADVLKENPSIGKVRVEGHTDNSGSSEHNHKLSKDRAEAVVKYLTEHGIDKSRIEAVGHGEDKPLVPNTNDTNKQLNRRTEFHILEVDGKPVDAAALTQAAGAAMATAGAAAADAGTPITPPPAAAATTPKPGDTVMKKK